MRNHDEDETRTITITELLSTARASCDFGEIPEDPDENAEWWQMMMREKASDSGFGHLVESIIKDGFDPSAPIGYHLTENGGYITEGHHRIVAAILLGMDEVYYSDYGGRCHRGISAHRSWDDPWPIELD